MTGATGLIGRRLLSRLLAQGHRVVCAGRRPPASRDPHCTWLKLDFTATPAEAWVAHLRGVEVVINLVGIFREHGAATFEAVHVRGPIALFEACVTAQVRRVIQVSALGADARAEAPFLATKYRADRHLLGLPLDGCVAQPSLVFAADGPSSRAFLTLASLPLLLLPARGQQRIQPVHGDDVAQALMALLFVPPGTLQGRRVALVGPASITLADYLRTLRRVIGLTAPVASLSIPPVLMRAAARLSDWQRGALLDSDAWRMLQRGNTADASLITALLGRPPRPASDFVAEDQREPLRVLARLQWLQPVLRLSLAMVWLVTALVSFGLYPPAQSHALLARAGVPPAWQPLALGGAAFLDLLLGVLTLWRFPGQRWLWPAQGLLIAFYSLVIAWRLPEFWLHPYGPMTKNLPLLALLCLLWCLEPPSDRRPGWTM